MHINHTLILLRQHAKPHRDVGNAASPPGAGTALCLVSQRLRG